MKINKPQTLIASALSILILRILIGFVVDHFSKEFQGNTGIDIFNGLSLFDRFVIVVILAPLFETLIFQFGVIELLSKAPSLARHQGLNLVAITTSSVLFSLSHFQSSFYAFSSFWSGLLYSSSYVFLRNRFDTVIAFVVVAISHSFYNLFVFSVEQLQRN